MQQNSVISSNANLGLYGQGLLKLTGDGDAIKGQRLSLSLFYNITVSHSFGMVLIVLVIHFVVLLISTNVGVKIGYHNVVNHKKSQESYCNFKCLVMIDKGFSHVT